MRAKIVIPKDEAELYRDLLLLSDEELCSKYDKIPYGIYSYTVRFSDGAIVSIEFICSEFEKAYTKGDLYMFRDSRVCITHRENLEGEWYFEWLGEEYYVDVVFEEDCDMEYSSFFSYINKVQYNECDKNS